MYLKKKFCVFNVMSKMDSKRLESQIRFVNIISNQPALISCIFGFSRCVFRHPENLKKIVGMFSGQVTLCWGI